MQEVHPGSSHRDRDVPPEWFGDSWVRTLPGHGPAMAAKAQLHLSLSLCPPGLSRPPPTPTTLVHSSLLQDHTGAESEVKALGSILEMLKHLGELIIFPSTSSWPGPFATFSLSSVDPPQSQWGAHLPGVWKNTQSPTPSATSCFPEYTLSLSLVPCNLFWEKLPSCIPRGLGRTVLRSWASHRKKKPVAVILPEQTKRSSRQVLHGDSLYRALPMQGI